MNPTKPSPYALNINEIKFHDKETMAFAMETMAFVRSTYHIISLEPQQWRKLGGEGARGHSPRTTVLAQSI